MAKNSMDLLELLRKRDVEGDVLAEQHDEWAEGRRYLTFANGLDAETLPASNVLEAVA